MRLSLILIFCSELNNIQQNSQKTSTEMSNSFNILGIFFPALREVMKYKLKK